MVKIKYKQAFLPITILLVSVLALIFLSLSNIINSDNKLLLVVIRSAIYLSFASVINSFINIIIPESTLAKSVGNSLTRVLINFLTTTSYLFVFIFVYALEFRNPITGGIIILIISILLIGTFFKERMVSYFLNFASEAERSFSVGDWISVETDNPAKSYLGQIIDLNRKYLILKTEENTIVSVPVTLLGLTVIRNYLDGNTSIKFGFLISYNNLSEIERIKRILYNSVYQSFYEKKLSVENIEILVQSITENKVTYNVIYSFKPWADFVPANLKSRILENINNNMISCGMIRLSTGETILSTRNVIKSINLFNLLNDEELEILSNKARIISFDSGSIIIKEKESGESMFILTEGLLEVEITNTEDKKIVVGQILPGDFFGEMSLLTGEKRTANVKTVLPSSVIEIDKITMAAIFEKRPALIEHISKVVATRKSKNIKLLDEGDRKSHSLADHLLKKIRLFFNMT